MKKESTDITKIGINKGTIKMFPEGR
jgi:hypothetical protein